MLSQVIVSSLTLGSVYALAALGFAVIYRGTDVVSFAQGELMMISAVIALVLFRDLGVVYILTIPVAVGSAMFIAYLVEWVAFRPLLGAPHITVLLSTVAVGQIIRSGVRAFHGDDFGLFPSIVSGAPIEMLGARFTAVNLLVIGMAALTLAIFAFFFARTRMGWAMRATAQNARGAAIVGISVPRTFSIAWVIAGGLAAVAGLLMAPLVIVSPDMGIIANKGFVAAIIGGFGSLPGAVVGGLVLGITENLLGVYVSSAFKDMLVFGVLILFLLLRPTGLFGRKVVNRV